MKKVATLACLVLTLSVVAQAAIIDAEPNNSIATAVPANLGANLADAGVFSLGTASDVDFVAVEMKAGDYLTAVATPMIPNFQTPDTFMGLLDANGTLLAYDEDSDPDSSDPSGYGSMLQYRAARAGTYYVAVTGFTDTDFNNKDLNFDGYSDQTNQPHGQIGTYILTLSVVPEPATLTLLAMASLGLIRRKF